MWVDPYASSVGHSALVGHPEAEVVPTPPTCRSSCLPGHNSHGGIKCTMASRRDRLKMRRPWTTATAILTAAHHGFELSSGVGLVLQPELGLGFAGALWGTGIPAWIRIAAKMTIRGGIPSSRRGLGRRWRAWSSISTFGPGGTTSWEYQFSPRRRLLHPQVFLLTTRCSMSGQPLPLFSIIGEVRPGARRWALVGLATMPLLRRSPNTISRG